MTAVNVGKVFEESLPMVARESRDTAVILRKLCDSHGPEAALDALLLVLIKRASSGTSAFSYLDAKWHFWNDHPRATALLEKALRASNPELVQRPRLR